MELLQSYKKQEQAKLKQTQEDKTKNTICPFRMGHALTVPTAAQARECVFDACKIWNNEKQDCNINVVVALLTSH